MQARISVVPQLLAKVEIVAEKFPATATKDALFVVSLSVNGASLNERFWTNLDLSKLVGATAVIGFETSQVTRNGKMYTNNRIKFVCTDDAVVKFHLSASSKASVGGGK